MQGKNTTFKLRTENGQRQRGSRSSWVKLSTKTKKKRSRENPTDTVESAFLLRCVREAFQHLFFFSLSSTKRCEYYSFFCTQIYVRVCVYNKAESNTYKYVERKRNKKKKRGCYSKKNTFSICTSISQFLLLFFFCLKRKPKSKKKKRTNSYIRDGNTHL